MSTKYEKLEELYASLPKVECKRLCQEFCGPILIPKIEARRLEEKRGWLETTSAFEASKRVYLPAPEIIQREFVGLRPEENLRCKFLAPIVGTCMVYSIRPLVCRCWGLVDTPLMRCPHGCVPSRWITETEFRELNYKIIAIQEGSADGND